MKLLFVAAAFVTLLAPGRAVAQQPADLLEKLVEETTTFFSAEPEWREDYFSEKFQAAVPDARFTAILTHYYTTCGACVGYVTLSRDSKWSGVFRLVFEKDFEVDLTIAAASSPPHVVDTWVVGAPVPAVPTFAALGERFAALPGTASLCVMELGEEPAPVFELKSDAPLAIGSAFKLYVLGALVAEVAAERRSWSDTLVLRDELQSIPTGFLQDWPAGSSHTLEALAGFMISQSDNTATDHLLLELGRERVEEQVGRMGNRHADRSRPFLATVEMFKLKWTEGGKRAEAWLALDEEGRRAYLDRELAGVSKEEIDLGMLSRVSHIDTIEWFASTADLCRAMDWLRRNTAVGAASRARALLAINPGTNVPRESFRYVGFKGGSEPGVLNLTWLVERADGRWFAVAATWNNPEAEVDLSSFVGLASRAFYLLTEEGD